MHLSSVARGAVLPSLTRRPSFGAAARRTAAHCGPHLLARGPRRTAPPRQSLRCTDRSPAARRCRSFFKPIIIMAAKRVKVAAEERIFLFSSESVNEGHPDKLADQVSDAVLDACLAADPYSKAREPPTRPRGAARRSRRPERAQATRHPPCRPLLASSGRGAPGLQPPTSAGSIGRVQLRPGRIKRESIQRMARLSRAAVARADTTTLSLTPTLVLALPRSRASRAPRTTW